MIDKDLVDPFFISNLDKEIIIEDKYTIDDHKVLVQCIVCKIEFDPKSEIQKKIPTINFCYKCYKSF